jgi:hypothetical protein
MRTKERNCLAVNFIGVLLLCASGVFADYIEGIDTTDVNGYGLDSAFKVTNGLITGQNIVIYHGELGGYYNYSFDDIKIAADKFNIAQGPSKSQNQLYCFVIRKNKDSTYSKIQILKNLPNNRYVYKYGSNSIPNNRLLVKTPYDTSVRYKPNNLNNVYQYGCCGYPGDPTGMNTCSWEPPLPNRNHLLGYIFYKSKPNVVIDTTKPINKVQWDSCAFTPYTSSTCWPMSYVYLNMVAVYSEGRSDFLQGWTKSSVGAVDVKPSSTQIEKIQNRLEIKKTSHGFYLTFQSFTQTSGSASISIYNVTGTKVAEFSNIQGNQVFWKTTDRNLAQGQYIAMLELPDKRVLSGRMVYSK